MSNAETLYSFRSAYPDVLERGRAQLLDQEVYRDGVLVAPTEAGSTVTLYGPDGSSVWSSAVTVTGDIAQATIPASSLPDTIDLGEGYSLLWSLVIGGVTYNKRREASVALRAFYPEVTDLDLEGEYPDLDRDLGTSLTSWQTFIDEAWKQIINRLRREGVLPYLVISTSVFREPHKHLALYLTLKWFHRNSGSDGPWLELYKHHYALYKESWAAITFTMDKDHDGVLDTPDRQSNAAVIHLNTAPSGRRRNDPRF